jgi:hypothetical protein
MVSCSFSWFSTKDGHQKRWDWSVRTDGQKQRTEVVTSKGKLQRMGIPRNDRHIYVRVTSHTKGNRIWTSHQLPPGACQGSVWLDASGWVSAVKSIIVSLFFLGFPALSCSCRNTANVHGSRLNLLDLLAKVGNAAAKKVRTPKNTSGMWRHRVTSDI